MSFYVNNKNKKDLINIAYRSVCPFPRACLIALLFTTIFRQSCYGL